MKLRLAVAIAAFSGFLALSYEIVWYRVLSFMTRGTAATFGLLLAAYLFGLALGSRASARFCTGAGGDARQLRVIAAFAAIANVVAALVVPTFAWSARFTDFRLGLVVVAIGAAFLGSVLPLVSHFGIAPDDRAGSRLSYVYLANILGSAAGSLLTGFVLMDAMPLVSIARVLVVLGFALPAVLLLMAGLPTSRAASALGAVVAGAALAAVATPHLHHHLWERLLYKNEWNGTQAFAQVIENKSGVITVAADGSVYGGGGYDGVINTKLQENDKNGILRAYVVGALHPAPKKVLVVGLSGGAWAEVVAHVPGVEQMTIVEINPGYVDVVRANAEVAPILDDPKAKIFFDDGRRWLLRHPEERFDFILMNTTLHWRGHATNILSKEFMDIARRHLARGGIFYFNTTDSYDVQLTAAVSFRHMMRITNFVAVSDDPFDFDRARWRTMLMTMKLQGKPILDLEQPRDRELFEDLLGFNDMEYAPSIKERYAKTKTVVTDDNMFVEWQDPLRYPELK